MERVRSFSVSTLIISPIPSHSKPGDTLRVMKKGMQIKGSSVRGDMMIILDIDMPVKVSDEEKDLIEKLKNINVEVETLEKK